MSNSAAAVNRLNRTSRPYGGIFSSRLLFQRGNGAADGIRTHDILLGRQMLYQLSYRRSVSQF